MDSIKMAAIVIIGAGAIGRGYLPWVLDTNQYDLIFVDINDILINQLNNKRQYTTYRARNGNLERKVVPVKGAFHLSEYSLNKNETPAAVFINVGPRNCSIAAKVLAGVNCPVIMCENDPETVAIVKAAINYDKVYFAIPDVITSSSASIENLKKDPLAIHTEDGVLFIDDRAKTFAGDINFCDESELNKQWAAKLYIHNTSHCIAAYLGALVGVQYLHEAVKIPVIYKIVQGAMNEMLTMLKLRWDIPHDFLDWYAEKELKRFSNELLFDPIKRVAREPLRKLELEGRLIGAAQICLSVGFVPQNILTGIVSALLFVSDDDMDKHLQFMRKSLSPKILLTYIVGLRKGEVLEMVMEERYPKIVAELEALVQHNRVTQ